MRSPVREDVFSDALVDCMLHGVGILLVRFLTQLPLHSSVIVGVIFSRRLRAHGKASSSFSNPNGGRSVPNLNCGLP